MKIITKAKYVVIFTYNKMKTRIMNHKKKTATAAMLHFKHKQPETLDNRATTNSRRNIALQSIDGEGS